MRSALALFLALATLDCARGRSPEVAADSGAAQITPSQMDAGAPACEIRFDAGASRCFPWPKEPRLPQRGDPGPCDVVFFELDGGFQAHNGFAYDDAGRLTRQTRYAEDGGELWTVRTGYDSCGNVTWRTQPGLAEEIDYEEHGLPSRTITSRGSMCSVSTQRYSFDDGGNLRQLLDEKGEVLQQYDWDGGRLVAIGDRSYTYFEDGGMRSTHFCGEESRCSTFEWDETGAPTLSVRDGEDTVERKRWIYGSNHALQEADYVVQNYNFSTIQFFQFSSTQLYRYDGGVLWSMDETYVMQLRGSPDYVTHTAVDYSDPLLELAEVTDADGGVLWRWRKMLDVRGNVIAWDRADAPDLLWRPYKRQRYDCSR